MAVGTNPLVETAGFVEAVDRRDQRFAIVFQQQSTVHQPHQTATTLTPTLHNADHFAAAEVDVVAPVAKRPVDFADGGIATQLDQQVADRLA